MNHNPQTFGYRLKRLRRDRGLRQAELRAEMEQQTGVVVGISYISELERTDKMPSLAVAAAMARVLHASVDYLALLTDEPNSEHDPEPEHELELNYLSPEAEEIAELVDAMPIEMRCELLAVARRLADAYRITRARAPRREDR